MTAELTFNDHFSGGSARYAQYRPDYPDELFRFLAQNCSRQTLALDCATGSGQAALGLSHYFDGVIAIDASETQIASAIANPRIHYRKALAEQTGLEGQSVDLVSVAQALHWFDHPRFFSEARRVLRPGGLLAAWCYELCSVNDACDAEVQRLYEEIVGEFWPPERRFIDAHYATIEFPEPCIDSPGFQMQVGWHVSHMLGYLRTWSACRRYEDQHGQDPVSIIEPALSAAWGDVKRSVRWPITLRACRF